MQANVYNDVPFDPSQLKVEVKNTTIKVLCDMLEHDMIDMQPDFQRHANLWDIKKKSRFIESIILGIPIPSMFFYVDMDSKKWVVIDGLQRLCALYDFMVTRKARLKGLELLRNLENFSVDEFSYFDQLDMAMRNVTLNVISGDASRDAIYLIFKRINSEGLALRPAEIRNALYRGKGMDFIKSIADDAEFLKLIDGAVSTKRMVHYDYVARFMAFYINGYQSYKDKMDTFLGDTLNNLNTTSEQYLFTELRETFFRSLRICCSLLDEDVFRSPIVWDNKKKSNPMSITLFETMMCSVSHLDMNQAQNLLNQKNLYRDMYYTLFQDHKLQKMLAQGTGQPNSVHYRFEKMDQLVKNVMI